MVQLNHRVYTGDRGNGYVDVVLVTAKVNGSCGHGVARKGNRLIVYAKRCFYEKYCVVYFPYDRMPAVVAECPPGEKLIAECVLPGAIENK